MAYKEPKVQELLDGRVKLQVYDALCSLKTFTIDGERVDEDDFFYKDDVGRDYAEPYACGNMQGTALKATDKVLKKYNLTVDEFNTVAEEAADLVSFGSCGWCV
jgi:hypothetical protein